LPRSLAKTPRVQATGCHRRSHPASEARWRGCRRRPRRRPGLPLPVPRLGAALCENRRSQPPPPPPPPRSQTRRACRPPAAARGGGGGADRGTSLVPEAPWKCGPWWALRSAPPTRRRPTVVSSHSVRPPPPQPLVRVGFLCFFPSLFCSLVRVEPHGARCGGGARTGPVPRSVHGRRAFVRPRVSGVWAVSAAKGGGGAPFSLGTAHLVGCCCARPWADGLRRASASPPPVCPPARPPACRSAWCIHCRLSAARSRGAVFAAAEHKTAAVGRGRRRTTIPAGRLRVLPGLAVCCARVPSRRAAHIRFLRALRRTVRRANDAALGA